MTRSTGVEVHWRLGGLRYEPDGSAPDRRLEEPVYRSDWRIGITRLILNVKPRTRSSIFLSLNLIGIERRCEVVIVISQLHSRSQVNPFQVCRSHLEQRSLRSGTSHPPRVLVLQVLKPK